MTRTSGWCCCACLLALASALYCSAADDPKSPPRAELPRFDKLPRDIFFRDAFHEALVGPRPASLGKSADGPQSVNSSKAHQSPDRAGQRWSEKISVETLEDEVKRLQISLNQLITTPARFSSGGFKDARRQFSELAILFAIIAEYDEKVRWQKDAPAARDAFARAAANAKVSSLQAFKEAKQRRLDLEDLIRGGSFATAVESQAQANWENVADRTPLMQRLKECYDDGLAKWTVNASIFQNNAAVIRREAELLHAFAEVLTKEGMEDAGDEEYEAYARQLGAAASEIREAVLGNDYQAAGQAADAIGKSCNRCHEDYRG